jgi:hypothetical protein
MQLITEQQDLLLVLLITAEEFKYLLKYQMLFKFLISYFYLINPAFYRKYNDKQKGKWKSFSNPYLITDYF